MKNKCRVHIIISNYLNYLFFIKKKTDCEENINLT